MWSEHKQNIGYKGVWMTSQIRHRHFKNVKTLFKHSCPKRFLTMQALQK